MYFFKYEQKTGGFKLGISDSLSTQLYYESNATNNFKNILITILWRNVMNSISFGIVSYL